MIHTPYILLNTYHGQPFRIGSSTRCSSVKNASQVATKNCKIFNILIKFIINIKSMLLDKYIPLSLLLNLIFCLLDEVLLRMVIGGRDICLDG